MIQLKSNIEPFLVCICLSNVLQFVYLYPIFNTESRSKSDSKFSISESCKFKYQF